MSCVNRMLKEYFKRLNRLYIAYIAGLRQFTKRVMERVNCSKPGYSSITYSKISNISYIILFLQRYLMISRLFHGTIRIEYVGDVTIPPQVIMCNQCYSRHISANQIAVSTSNQIITICLRYLNLIHLELTVDYYINRFYFCFRIFSNNVKQFWVATKVLKIKWSIIFK